MEDRQKFDEHRLPNGTTVYSHRMEVPYFSIILLFPIGSAHSHEGNPGGMLGIAHFLEHALFSRSEKYPEKDAFQKMISLKGVSWNAATGPFNTDIYIDAPVAIQDEAIEGLLNHVFHPIFDEDDLMIERAIVANERDREKYYPGSTEREQYLDTEWMQNRYYPKTQIFGSDADLAAMTPAALEKFLENYRTRGLCVVVGGGHDLQPILNFFSKLEVGDHPLESRVEKVGWAHREFHQKAFRDISSPAYYLGSIFPHFNFFENYALGFILRLLTNSVHGPLYEWARKEKGWTYGIDSGRSTNIDRMEGWIKITLNSIEPLQEIRNEIHSRIKKALSDKTLIAAEYQRREYQRLFFYQTLDERMDAACYDLSRGNHVFSETEYQEMNQRLNDSDLLLSLYEKYLSPEVTGEFLSLPETFEQ